MKIVLNKNKTLKPDLGIRTL